MLVLVAIAPGRAPAVFDRPAVAGRDIVLVRPVFVERLGVLVCAGARFMVEGREVVV